ncbi:MAG: hypothetical protein HY332_12020, partial [Chloroflexi bacterium]|nr:hypothetical protein [Chloroflexota bacterium]
MGQWPAAFSVGVDEGDVRRLCGDPTYARADALQKGGHVVEPLVNPNTLRAAVRGTWHRVDLPVVGTRGNRPTSRCTCGLPGFCRHVGALLLQWIRLPSSFKTASSVASGDDKTGGLVADQAPLLALLDEAPPAAPADDFAAAFEHETTSRLRHIAGMRGLNPGGRSKAELVQHVASALSEPARIDAALATLDHDQRPLLEAIFLMGGRSALPAEAIAAAYHALGGKQRQPSFAALLDSGLLLLGRPPYANAPNVYRLPWPVAARLPARDDLVRPVDSGDGGAGAAAATSKGESASEDVRRAVRVYASRLGVPRLGFGEVLIAVAHDMAGGRLRWRDVPEQERRLLAFAPAGWQLDPAHLDALAQPQQLYYRRHALRLVQRPPFVAAEDLKRLAGQTGRPAREIAFAVQALLTLGVPGGRRGRRAVRARRSPAPVARALPECAALGPDPCVVPDARFARVDQGRRRRLPARSLRPAHDVGPGAGESAAGGPRTGRAHALDRPSRALPVVPVRCAARPGVADGTSALGPGAQRQPGIVVVPRPPAAGQAARSGGARRLDARLWPIAGGNPGRPAGFARICRRRARSRRRRDG